MQVYKHEFFCRLYLCTGVSVQPFACKHKIIHHNAAGASAAVLYALCRADFNMCAKVAIKLRSSPKQNETQRAAGTPARPKQKQRASNNIVEQESGKRYSKNGKKRKSVKL